MLLNKISISLNKKGKRNWRVFENKIIKPINFFTVVRLMPYSTKHFRRCYQINFPNSQKFNVLDFSAQPHKSYGKSLPKLE